MFEFRPDKGTVIGFRAGYEAEPIREDGSGRRVAVAGREVIVVRLSPARDVEFDGDGRAQRTYHGPAAVEPRGGRRIVEVRHISSFEGTVKWAIGIDRRRAFRVATLSSPPRLVIDIGPEP